MLRIGMMLDSYVTSAWVEKIVEDIQASDFGRVELVVLNTPIAPKPLSLRERVRANWRLTAYYRYEQWDYLRNRGKNETDSSDQRGNNPLDPRPCPRLSGLRDRGPPLSRPGRDDRRSRRFR